MHRFETGQLYHPDRRSWPETVQYQYRGGGHELIFFLGSPSPKEVEAIRIGPADFALYQDGDLLLLLYRFRTPLSFNAIDWSDAPFSYWRLPEEERVPPSRGLAADARAILMVQLVDAATGILLVNRVVSWSAEFTAHVHAAIADQVALGAEAPDYDRRLERLMATASTTRLLARAVARTTGGA